MAMSPTISPTEEAARASATGRLKPERLWLQPCRGAKIWMSFTALLAQLEVGNMLIARIGSPRRSRA